MNIIEICRQDKSIIWHDGKTFLSVYNEKNKQIADYDFSTGLKLMQDGNSIIVFISDEDLVPGNWKFVGTKIIQKENKIFEEKFEYFGKKDGNPKKRKYLEKDPWNVGRVNGEYSSSRERERRMNICRSCTFLNHLNGECSIDGNLVIESTKQKYSYCPEDKWGNKEKVIKKISLSPEGDIIMPDPIKIDEEDQQNFEKDLEEFLKEL